MAFQGHPVQNQWRVSSDGGAAALQPWGRSRRVVGAVVVKGDRWEQRYTSQLRDPLRHEGRRVRDIRKGETVQRRVTPALGSVVGTVQGLRRAAKDFLASLRAAKMGQPGRGGKRLKRGQAFRARWGRCAVFGLERSGHFWSSTKFAFASSRTCKSNIFSCV